MKYRNSSTSFHKFKVSNKQPQSRFFFGFLLDFTFLPLLPSAVAFGAHLYFPPEHIEAIESRYDSVGSIIPGTKNF